MHFFPPHWTAQRRKLPVHARPNLEFLERRDCPSAPSITSLTSTQLSGNTTQVSGYVTDPNPAGVTVSFEGAVTGQAIANASGYFAFQSLGFTPGPLTAQAVDGAGLTSNPVVVNLAGFAPQVSVSVAYNANGTATLSGLVTDPHPGGLQLVFNGVLSGSAQTTANGDFSLTTLVPTTGQVIVTTTDPFNNQSSTSVPVQVDGPAPVVTSFQSTALANGSWTFSGQVLDRNPTSVQLSFGGLNSLQGKPIALAANGTFSLTTTLQPGEAGQAWVKAANGTGLGSNMATAFTANPPGLTLNLTSEEGKTVLLTGQVTDPNPGGLTVTFTGVASGSVVTKADGTFSVQLQATALGTIQGVVVNSSGVASKPAVVTVASAPPVITALVANDEAGVWVFTGTVTGPWVDGLMVSFSGLPAVDNESVTVGANGGFSLVVSIPPEEDGTVSATTMDVWGQTSNTASWLVRQS